MVNKFLIVNAKINYSILEYSFFECEIFIKIKNYFHIPKKFRIQLKNLKLVLFEINLWNFEIQFYDK